MRRFFAPIHSRIDRIRSRYHFYTYGRSKIAEPSREVEAQHHGTYGALLLDKRWRARRLEILNRDRNACVICGNKERLQIHHRQYHFIKAMQKFKAPWDYESRLMITLCESCHSRGHNKFRVPRIYI